MFGMMTLCMVAMLALFYLGMIARDARCTSRERKDKKRHLCKVARFNYRIGAGGAPDDLLFVTPKHPKPVLHDLTERGSSSVGMPQGTFLRIKGSYVILTSHGESPVEPKLTHGVVCT